MSQLLLLLVLGADIGSPLPPIVEQRFQAIETDVARHKIEIVKLRLDVEALKRMCDKCDPPTPVAKAAPVGDMKIGCICGDNCKCTGAKYGMDCGCIATSVHLQKDPEVKASLPPQTFAAPEVEYVQRRVCNGNGTCHFETVAVARQPSVSAPVVYTSSTASECSSCGTSSSMGVSGGGCAGGNCGSSGGRGGPLKAIGRALFGGKNR